VFKTQRIQTFVTKCMLAKFNDSATKTKEYCMHLFDIKLLSLVLFYKSLVKRARLTATTNATLYNGQH